MRIIANSNSPDLLLRMINDKIQENELKTWEIIKTKGGIVYNHKPAQWSEKALIKPTSYPNIEEVHFEIVFWKDENEPDESIKGYLIGRFTEILMVQFRDYFDTLKIE